MNIGTQVRGGALSDTVIRCSRTLVLTLGATFCCGALTAQGIPATAPAGSTAAQPVQAPSFGASPEQRTRYRAEVVVTGTQIEIRADNSSLNGILRSLSQQTGMRITGGVRDQRVFGTYGPGPADQVLSQLLQDTGTNMILRQSSSGGPGELILSPRMGGPSPPSPSSMGADPEEAQMAPAASAASVQPGAAPQKVQQQPLVPPLPFSKPAMPPAATDPMQTPVTPDPQGIVEPPLVSPATEPGTTPGPTTQTTGMSDTTSGRTAPASPNGVKTPQQIYEELQKLRQQQQPQANQ